MLTISERHMVALKRGTVQQLTPKIDSWLLREHPDWLRVDSMQRTRLLDEMLSVAGAFGMETETDFALFCDLMIGVGPDWRRFADSPEAREVSDDPEARPPGKLEELAELAMQMAEGLGTAR